MSYDLRQLLFVDVETSGLDPAQHQLLSAAFVPGAGSRVAPLVLHVHHPHIRWTASAQSLFSASLTDWEKAAIPVEEARRRLHDFVAALPMPELLLVGHNVGFDLSFLKQLDIFSCPKISHRSIDTHTLLRMLHWAQKIPESACTSTGAFEYFDVNLSAGKRHTALGDALATRMLFMKVAKFFEDLETPRSSSVAAQL